MCRIRLSTAYIWQTLCVRFAHLRGGLYKEAALLQICSNGHSTIVHECNRCPLCALTEHNNSVHDFIESKGRGLVSELVAYQHRKAAGQGERPANVTQQRQHAMRPVRSHYTCNHPPECINSDGNCCNCGAHNV